MGRARSSRRSRVVPTGGITLVGPGFLAPDVVFTRASSAWLVENGQLRTFGSGVPRFDASGRLLIEAQRTNLLARSIEFDNAAWLKIAATVTTDTALAPDGTNTADRLVPTTAFGRHLAEQSFSALAATPYTFSCFLENDGYNGQLIVGRVSGEQAYAYFDLTTGAVGASGSSTGNFTNVSGTISPAANGFFRSELCYTNVLAGTNALGVAISDRTAHSAPLGENSPSFTGNTLLGTLAWGAQVEAGAFSTSYIPTSTGAVTRLSDSLHVPFAPFGIVPTTGFTLVGTMMFPFLGTNGSLFEYNDNTPFNRVAFFEAGGGNITSGAVVGGSGSTGGTHNGISAGVPFRVAARFRTTASVIEGALSANGAPHIAVVRVGTPTMTRIHIGGNGPGTGGGNVRLSDFRLINRFVPDAELRALSRPDPVDLITWP